MLGFAILAAIVLRFALPRLQKHSRNPFVASVFKSRGIQPTGPDGQWTRRDHLRAAGFSGTVALLLLGVAWLGATIEQHTWNGVTLNLIASGVMFLGAIGLLMACASALISLAKAALTRPSIPEHGA
jgi:hypothetical protein